MQVRKTDVRLVQADLRMIIAPRYFRAVVESVRVISGYNNQIHTYNTPSLAIRLGHDLRKPTQLLRSTAIEEEDRVTADSAQQFSELCAAEWTDDTAGTARRVLQNRKMNRPLLLPLAADVGALTGHLKAAVRNNLHVIEKCTDDARFLEAYKSLSEAVLASLILFNRRRQGEVSRLTVSMYEHATTVQRQTTDIDSSLSPLEQHLLHVFRRVVLPGQRNRRVPMSMTALTLCYDLEHQP